MIHFSRLGTLTFIAGGMLSVSLAPAAELDLHSSANSSQLLLSNSSRDIWAWLFAISTMIAPRR